MRFEALVNVRDRLKNHAPLAGYLAAHYPDAAPNWFIGAKLKPAATEFPYVAVAPTLEDKDAEPSRERRPRVSILYGVNDDAVVDGVYVGIQRICEIGELILDALGKQPIGAATWDGQAQSRSDAGLQHPFYEGEVMISLKVRA
jgi:hypothetical protein